MEVILEKGSKSTKGSYMEHPVDNIYSPPIQRTDESRIYSRIPTKDKSFRTKRMAGKYLYAKYYTTLYMRIAYTINTPYTILLHPPHNKKLAIY